MRGNQHESICIYPCHGADHLPDSGAADDGISQTNPQPVYSFVFVLCPLCLFDRNDLAIHSLCYGYPGRCLDRPDHSCGDGVVGEEFAAGFTGRLCCCVCGRTTDFCIILTKTVSIILQTKSHCLYIY